MTPTVRVTRTPTDTPSATPAPPNLVDPKEDSLLTDNDGNGLPSPGDILLYTISISNTGGSDAMGVLFADTPDSNTTLVAGSVTTTQGVVTVGNTTGDTSVGVSIGTIGVNASVTITFQVSINLNLPENVTQVENQGTTSGGNITTSQTDDPDTSAFDDPTVTLLSFPSPIPSSTPGGLDPTNTPPPAGTSTVLIPVTGVNRSAMGWTNLAALFQNVAIIVLGVTMAVHGWTLRGRREGGGRG